MSAECITDIPKLSARLPNAHKGDFGRILVVGGSRGMVGAPALAANSALRSGAGLVTIATPGCVQQTVASLAWCATSIALPYEDGSGCISEKGVDTLRKAIIAEKRFDVVAVGPGLGPAMAVNRLIAELIDAQIPMVIDADALNNLSRINWHGILDGKCVMTPHPGELSRLLDKPIKEIQNARQDLAMEAVRRMTNSALRREAVCLLKGAGTVVTDAERIYINQTGNPGMATGGSGDVLTGVIAALIGQGLDCFDAAVLGAYVHGLAGDLAAKDLGQISLIAEDIMNHLPKAFNEFQSKK
jgi:NAD(P)H-hydrate epimerase